MFNNPSTHYFGCNIGSPNDPVPRLSIYTHCANSGNLLVSDTSLSAYRNISMEPSELGVSCTPSAMHGKMIDASGCLCGDCVMGCFPFLYADALDVPTSSYISYHPESSFPVIYSSYTSSYCMDPTIGCGLGPPEFVLLLWLSFVLWVASALAGCCGLPLATGSWPCALFCD